MSRGTHVFTIAEVRRAVRAMQDAGIKIARIVLEGGRVELITTDDPKTRAAGGEDVDRDPGGEGQ